VRLGMIDPPPGLADPERPSDICWRSGWVRARRTGILRLEAQLGQKVREGERLGELLNSFGRRLALVKADRDGIVIGRTEAPLVNSGDALVHIGSPEPGTGEEDDGGLTDPADEGLV
jgi:uncharacterized protein